MPTQGRQSILANGICHEVPPALPNEGVFALRNPVAIDPKRIR